MVIGLRIHKLKASGVQISIRSNDLGISNKYQYTSHLATQSPSVIAHKAIQIFRDNYRWIMPVRAVTVRAINLRPKNEPEQIVPFHRYATVGPAGIDWMTVSRISGGGSGKQAVFQACLLGDLKMPFDNRGQSSNAWCGGR